MDVIKEGTFVIAAAYTYYAITGQKIFEHANLKYATVGGILGLVLGPKIEQYIRSDPDLTPEMKNKLLGAAVGGIGGYALGDKVASQTKKSFGGLEKRVDQ
ncbi:hypothetical protein AYK26_05195 [Euryarchaeota archaeon SM23-78]|nr:MAG: hypothetical protein AYK26_05195 [Euryarchaeota archaeon SM23-78]MBW3001158.1 hypothetical protein [Candidatus Woesearchaeota archaeon]